MPPLRLICDLLEHVRTLKKMVKAFKGRLDSTTNLVSNDGYWLKVSERHK
jgi:hypothetical protein